MQSRRYLEVRPIKVQTNQTASWVDQTKLPCLRRSTDFVTHISIGSGKQFT